MVLYATSRKGVDMGFKTGSGIDVKYSKLDIAESSSRQSFVQALKQNHATIDVLINNAGVNFDDQYSAQNAKTTLDTNVRGTLQVSYRPVCSLFHIADISADVPSIHSTAQQRGSNSQRLIHRVIAEPVY